MMPRKIVERRKQSRPARHTEAAPFACVGQLRMELGQHVVALFCDGCGARIEMRGVIPSPPEPQISKPWDPNEDPEDIEPWVG